MKYAILVDNEKVGNIITLDRLKVTHMLGVEEEYANKHQLPRWSVSVIENEVHHYE